MNVKNESMDKKLYRRAKARVGFKVHLLVFIAVMVFIWLINLLVMWNVGPKQWFHWWAIWPTLGWGLGVLLHGVGVYAGTGMVEREYLRLKRRHGAKEPSDE